MHRLGSPSWRLSVRAETQSIGFALSVRDRLDLPVPPSPAAPPKDERIPRLEPGMPDDVRAQAGPQWLAWWRRLVEAEFRMHAPIPLDAEPSVLIRRRFDEHRLVYDPPAFDALRASPALRSAALAVFEDSLTPSTSADPPRLKRGEESFPWNLIRDVAMALAEERGVSPDRLDAAVLLIDVPGYWHHIPQPGIAICTIGVATDPSAAEGLLRAVFLSGLEA